MCLDMCLDMCLSMCLDKCLDKCLDYPFHALLGKTNGSMQMGERRRPDLYGPMPKTRQLMFPGNGEKPVSALAHVRPHLRSPHGVGMTCVNNAEATRVNEEANT
jgi:hypothetical protein